MQFWIGWALWEKLSLVLVFLIVLVLASAYASLAYTRWKMRRYAAIEGSQKEEEGEIFPMLKRDDIPFGAKALERGLQIQGIWVSNHNTPIQTPQAPGTPLGSRPCSPAPKPPFLLPSPSSTSSSLALEMAPTNQNPTTYHSSLPQSFRTAYQPYHPEMDIVQATRYTYEPQRPGGIYSPVMTSQASNHSSRSSRFQRRSEIAQPSEKRSSFHSRLRRASHLFEKVPSAGLTEHEQKERTEPGSKSNGSGSQPDEPHRVSRITRVIRRRSSEEFRRRMSQIFNERIHMSVPADQLEFSPMLREKRRRQRGSILWPFQSEDSSL